MPATEMWMALLVRKVQMCQPNPSPVIFLSQWQLAQVGTSQWWATAYPAILLLGEGTTSGAHFNIQTLETGDKDLCPPLLSSLPYMKCIQTWR